MLFFFALLFLLVPQIAPGQTEKPRAPLSLTQLSSSLLSKAQMLEQRLVERAKQVSDLEAALQQARQRSDDSAASSEELERQLQAARESQASLQTELLATLSSLDQSEQTRQRLQAGWESYRTEMQSQVLEVQRQRDAYAWGAWVGGGATAGAIGGAALGRDAQSAALGALAGGVLGGVAKLLLR